MPAPRATTKHDVALADVHRKAERELAIVRGVSIAVWIAIAALPILALRELVEPLAGHTTKVDVNVVVSITLAISVVLNGIQYAKSRSQSRELRRQRERLHELERGQT